MGRFVFEKEDLISGVVLRRYQRFFVDVLLDTGETVTAHCPNTGTMSTCWEKGDRALLRTVDNPKRKLKFTWVACQRDASWIGVETGLANTIVAQAAQQGALPGFEKLHHIQTERAYGKEKSRIDVWALNERGQEVFIEVKNTTLRDGDHCLFPDAITERGTKHLRELATVCRCGQVGVILFLIHRTDVENFDVAREIDRTYANALTRAVKSGVQVLPLATHLKATQSGVDRWSLRWTLNGLLPWEKRTERIAKPALRKSA